MMLIISTMLTYICHHKHSSMAAKSQHKATRYEPDPCLVPAKPWWHLMATKPSY